MKTIATLKFIILISCFFSIQVYAQNEIFPQNSNIGTSPPKEKFDIKRSDLRNIDVVFLRKIEVQAREVEIIKIQYQ